MFCKPTMILTVMLVGCTGYPAMAETGLGLGVSVGGGSVASAGLGPTVGGGSVASADVGATVGGGSLASVGGSATIGWTGTGSTGSNTGGTATPRTGRDVALVGANLISRDGVKIGTITRANTQLICTRDLCMRHATRPVLTAEGLVVNLHSSVLAR